MKKYVYLFSEGNKDMRDLLGGKGANLAEMSNLGLPVPSGFVVTTESCLKYYENNETIDEEIVKEIFSSLEKLEEISGRNLEIRKSAFSISRRLKSKYAWNDGYCINLGINDEV